MPLISKQKELYRFAVDNQFIIPGFNIFDIESMQAVLEAADETDSPVAVHISFSSYTNLAPIAQFVDYFKAVANTHTAPIMLHHDYLPTVEACRDAVDMGFQSVSFDGQKLDLTDNIRLSRQVAEYAHSNNCLAEAELGRVPGAGFTENDVYTDPKQAAKFVKETGIDALAVSVGTSHGGLKRGRPLQIRYELLDAIKDAIGDVPLILHGAASRPAEYVDLVNSYGGQVEHLSMATEAGVSDTRLHGVAKIYADLDNWLCVTASLRKHFVEYPDSINPMQYTPQYGNAMKDAIIRKIERVTKSSGFGKAYFASTET